MEIENRINNLKKYYNGKINDLIVLYKTRRANILRSRLNYFYKRRYLSRIVNYFRSKINDLKKLLSEAIEKLKQEQQEEQEEQTEEQEETFEKKALIIGCNYVGTKNALRGCIVDANNIKNMLESKYNYKNIKLLTDETKDKPTRTVILHEIMSLLINSNENDELFMSFSGHGTYTNDNNSEEKDGKDELFVPLDFNCIRDDDFKSIIQKYLKKNVKLFMLFDCCHSGSMLDLKYQYLDSTNYNNPSVDNNNKETEGFVYMISGCMDSQTSADAYINNKFQGAMTWALLDTLKNNNDLSWKELLLDMRDKLKKSKFTQVPQLSSGRELDLNSKIKL